MASVLLEELVLAGRANDAEGCKCAPPSVDIYGMDDALSTMSLLDDLKSQNEDTVLAAFKRFRFYWNLGIAVAFLVIVVTFAFQLFLHRNSLSASPRTGSSAAGSYVVEDATVNTLTHPA